MPGESHCSPREIANYLNRVSGPLLDRIDLHIEVPAVKFQDITSQRTGEPSATIRERVISARQVQQQRFKHRPRVTCNARMGTRELKAHCALDESTLALLQNAMAEFNLSARAYDRILKVSRTTADLEGADRITADHVPDRPGRREPRAVKRRPKPYPLLNEPRRQFNEIRDRNRYRKNQPAKNKGLN